MDRIRWIAWAALLVISLALVGCKDEADVVLDDGSSSAGTPSLEAGEPDDTDEEAPPLPDESEGDDSDPPLLPEPDGQGEPGPGEDEQRAGISYDVTLTGFDGETIAFTVHEPETLVGGEAYPLLLFGHGFGAQRIPALGRDTPLSNQPGISIVGPPQAYLQAGYGEISIDQRGFGQSTGSVRVLDPEIEGRYLVQIVDWAEANLDWLAYRDDNLVLGARGGSYGGGYQLLLNNVDPRKRLDAIIPQITWYDLNYSLNVGNVPKSGYATALTGLSGTGGSFLDEQFVNALTQGLATGTIGDSAQQEFTYHSNRYFCENIDQPGRTVASDSPPPVDALFLQGSFDVLFNMNEALANYQCMEDAGGDVRLYTYPVGHVLPSGGSILLTPPDIRNAGLFQCGSLDEFTLSMNWFDAKLKRDPQAIAYVENLPEHCLVTDGTGRGVVVDEVTVGGTATPAFDMTVAQGALALPTGVPVTLYTAEEQGEVVAGIPTATITIEPPPVIGDPDGDAIIFVALARGRAGQPGNLEIIDDQVRPVRGLGEHEIELHGIAERLNAGDEIQLIVSGTALPQYPLQFNRNLQNTTVRVSGVVNLPLLGVLPEAP
ncbi:peptidase S15 [Salinisphaera dokdonensis CL-ES53]|uniref:Peptidase S15 n=1 Tax=Salinisphaera dokdonensis CL-ES53 TaxID=1304272 RepID=A0ABV2AY35_9GAMM